MDRRKSMFLMAISSLLPIGSGILTGCGSAPRPVARPERVPPASPSAGTLDEVLHRDPDPRRSEAVLIALSQVGLPYRWGGDRPDDGFDCSGLVVYVFRQSLQLVVPRTSVQQARRGHVIDREELRPADLVFFNTLRQPHSHVGIYVGARRFVHAPSARALVRLEEMDAAYWQDRFTGARRILT